MTKISNQQEKMEDTSKSSPHGNEITVLKTEQVDVQKQKSPLFVWISKQYVDVQAFSKRTQMPIPMIIFTTLVIFFVIGMLIFLMYLVIFTDGMSEQKIFEKKFPKRFVKEYLREFLEEFLEEKGLTAACNCKKDFRKINLL